MTDPLLPDNSSELSPALSALDQVGRRRRPVKLVEHPTFRAARARRDARLSAYRLSLVALNGPTAASPYPSAIPTLDRSQEAI